MLCLCHSTRFWSEENCGRCGINNSMFSVAILTGVYSYIIFLLGLVGYLYKENVILVTALYFFSIFLFYKTTIFRNLGIILPFISKIKKSKLAYCLTLLIIVQILVNLIGVLGPELAFDALWYHLTLPKIYLLNHSIDYISGGLLYYSTTPKLTEMLYVAGLSFGNEVFAKFIHFSFGIILLFALYKLSAKFFSTKLALLVCVIFYSNLVVGWLSVSAYVDLARTFFEIMTLWGFMNWREKGQEKWIIISAIMLGLAISTKLLAIGSLFIFTILITYFYIGSFKFKWKSLIVNILVYWCFSLLISLPWFAFSYVNTGNPVYPFFTHIYPINLGSDLINPIKFTSDIWNVFIKNADPISPIYIIFLAVVLFLYKKLPHKIKVVYLYSFLAILVWYITPRTGGGRFILPYLPAFSILVVYVLTIMKNISFRKIFITFIIFISLFSILYRFEANLKYIPVIFGHQSKSDFLTKNLNFSFGDFYDTDRYFEKSIKAGDKVLLYGFHNLYYFNFSFIDSSWVKKGDIFNYVAVQGNNLPERFKMWNLIYRNEKTSVKLYSAGGIKWTY